MKHAWGEAGHHTNIDTVAAVGKGLPATYARETDSAVSFDVDIPGVRKEDVSIQLTAEGMLKVSGSRKRDDHDNAEPLLSECKYGSFIRVFKLPTGVDSSAASADLKDGVLRIVLPKILREPQEAVDVPIS